MKIIVCPDSFKESLTAAEAAHVIGEVIGEVNPAIEVEEIPLADGGEGTADILKTKFPLQVVTLACDPLQRKRPVGYRLSATGKEAFIESAEIIGLPLLSSQERNPLVTTSLGLGEVIKDAIRQGVVKIFVSLGGSATCDAGIGMLEALGFEFLDSTGKILPATAECLTRIHSIRASEFCKKLKDVSFTVLSDVDNPLFGERGAAKIFAPQKGASESDVVILEKGLQHFSAITVSQGYGSASDLCRSGAGAAGGLGYSFFSYLNADDLEGIDFVMKSIDFDKKIEGADLIITGEGKTDRQSLMGKVLSGVLRKARAKNLPLIVISGKVEDREELEREGVSCAYEISLPNLTLEQNMAKENAIKNLRETTKNMLKNNIFEQKLK